MTENIIEMSDFPGRRMDKTKSVPQSTLMIEGKIAVEVVGVGEGATEVVREMAKEEFVLLNRQLFGPNCEFSISDNARQEQVPEIGIVVFDSSEIGSVRAALPVAKSIERAGGMGLSFDLSNNPPPKMLRVSNILLPIGVIGHSGTAAYLGVFCRGLIVPILNDTMIGIEFSQGPLAFWAGRSSWVISGEGQGENRALDAIQDATNMAKEQEQSFDDADAILLTIIVSPDFTMGEAAAMARMLDDSTLLGGVSFSYSTVVDDHGEGSVEAILVVTE
ncbi:MAG: hypothetical protein FVQ80_14910 [Planctomycetes bacterium]|nr:hypothetical protein [Planctomycetota bacterium]